MELGGAASHVLHDRVQTGQAAVDVLDPAGAVGLGEGAEVLQHVGEDQAGQVDVLHPGAQDPFDGPVGAVAELAELVDGLAVAVAGQGAGAGGVVEAVHDAVGGEFVEPPAQFGGGHDRCVGVVRGEFAQGRLDLVRADLDLVDLAAPVHGAQDPQVGDVVVAPGEVEQAEAVADGERVQIQRRAFDHSFHPRVLVALVRTPVCEHHAWAIVAVSGDGPFPLPRGAPGECRCLMR